MMGRNGDSLGEDTVGECSYLTVNKYRTGLIPRVSDDYSYLRPAHSFSDSLLSTYRFVLPLQLNRIASL